MGLGFLRLSVLHGFQCPMSAAALPAKEAFVLVAFLLSSLERADAAGLLRAAAAQSVRAGGTESSHSDRSLLPAPSDL